MRGPVAGVPGQIEMPRPPADGLGPSASMSFRSDFQISAPVSAFSAMIDVCNGKYITLPATIGVTV